MNGVLNKQSASCNAVLSLVKEYWAHALKCNQNTQWFSLQLSQCVQKKQRLCSHEWTDHAHSFVHVTVTKDDKGRLSSQFQRNLLYVTDCTALDKENTGRQGWEVMLHFVLTEFLKNVHKPSPLHDVFANLSGTSKAQFTDIRMVRQALSHQST